MSCNFPMIFSFWCCLVLSSVPKACRCFAVFCCVFSSVQRSGEFWDKLVIYNLNMIYSTMLFTWIHLSMLGQNFRIKTINLIIWIKLQNWTLLFTLVKTLWKHKTCKINILWICTLFRSFPRKFGICPEVFYVIISQFVCKHINNYFELN